MLLLAQTTTWTPVSFKDLCAFFAKVYMSGTAADQAWRFSAELRELMREYRGEERRDLISMPRIEPGAAIDMAAVYHEMEVDRAKYWLRRAVNWITFTATVCQGNQEDGDQRFELATRLVAQDNFNYTELGAHAERHRLRIVAGARVVAKHFRIDYLAPAKPLALTSVP